MSGQINESNAVYSLNYYSQHSKSPNTKVCTDSQGRRFFKIVEESSEGNKTVEKIIAIHKLLNNIDLSYDEACKKIDNVPENDKKVSFIKSKESKEKLEAKKKLAEIRDKTKEKFEDKLGKLDEYQKLPPPEEFPPLPPPLDHSHWI